MIYFLKLKQVLNNVLVTNPCPDCRQGKSTGQTHTGREVEMGEESQCFFFCLIQSLSDTDVLSWLHGSVILSETLLIMEAFQVFL